MSLALDFSGDPATVWDFTEAVTCRQHQRNGDLAKTVNVALRSQVSNREKSPSNGAYTGFETNWFLPGALLGNYVPKPGDTITDAADTVFTILAPTYDQADKVYECGTVDLALAYDLRDLIDIERATLSYDTVAAPVRTWTTPAYVQIAAKVQLLTAELADTLDIRGFKGKYAVTIDRQVAITAEDRVKWSDGGTIRYLDILGHRNPQRIDELPVLDCVIQP